MALSRWPLHQRWFSRLPPERQGGQRLGAEVDRQDLDDRQTSGVACAKM
jgi:hypothetical protein